MSDQLLKIKRLREDDAVATLVAARSSLEQQIAACTAKEAEKTEYKSWRKAEEERLYQDIYGQEVSLQTLEKLREKVAALRARELQLHEEHLQAKKDVETAQAAVEEARLMRVEAHKQTVKYEEYNQQLLDEEKDAQERREESELEDYALKKA